MNFRDQMNDHLNQFPDELRNSRSVRVFADSIISSYETLLSWVGPDAIRFDINWNHLIALIRGIVHIQPDNLTSYIENFQVTEVYILPEYNDADNNEQQNDEINEEDLEVSDEDDDSDSDSDSDPDPDEDGGEDGDEDGDEDGGEDGDEDGDEDGGENIRDVLDDDQRWTCIHCFRFTGSYSTVEQHESICHLNHNHIACP